MVHQVDASARRLGDVREQGANVIDLGIAVFVERMRLDEQIHLQHADLARLHFLDDLADRRIGDQIHAIARRDDQLAVAAAVQEINAPPSSSGSISNRSQIAQARR